jgi:hypothetical protein
MLTINKQVNSTAPPPVVPELHFAKLAKLQILTNWQANQLYASLNSDAYELVSKLQMSVAAICMTSDGAILQLSIAMLSVNNIGELQL